jgi:putative ABC transport system permease protein
VIRTNGDPRMAAVTIRGAIRSLDSPVILSPAITLREQLSDQLAPRGFQTFLLSLFSIIALLLASLGVFTLMHYSVAQRTHEMGVRVALGAQHGDVLRMILREGGRVATAGLATGVLAAFALTRLLSSLLFDVSATDPVTFAGVVVLLAFVALAGCYFPARRATRVDPVVTLRYE